MTAAIKEQLIWALERSKGNRLEEVERILARHPADAWYVVQREQLRTARVKWQAAMDWVQAQ